VFLKYYIVKSCKSTNQDTSQNGRHEMKIQEAYEDIISWRNSISSHKTNSEE